MPCASTPKLFDLAREALNSVEIYATDMVITVDLGRNIGMQDLVATSEADEIVYAKRLNRDIFTRFTRSQKPQPSSMVTLVIQSDDSRLILASTWIGPAVPR